MGLGSQGVCLGEKLKSLGWWYCTFKTQKQLSVDEEYCYLVTRVEGYKEFVIAWLELIHFVIKMRF